MIYRDYILRWPNSKRILSNMLLHTLVILFPMIMPEAPQILVDLFADDKPVRDKGKRDRSIDNVEYEKEVAWAQKRE
ncbi:hypothetical protein KY289_001116 [Solanum tuberosum]|nr:hypothetical protein KY289_001116 [Solanum tuberosum]